MPAPISPESTAEFLPTHTFMATTEATNPTSTLPPDSVLNTASTPEPTTIPTQEIQPTMAPSCPTFSGPFTTVWIPIQERIGCATGGAIQGQIVEENFEGGKMFWRESIDYAQALVLFNNGTWQIFQHSPYVEGSAEFSCPDNNTPSQCPPTPKRGFGMMWCNIPEIRNALGNATDCDLHSALCGRGYTLA